MINIYAHTFMTATRNTPRCTRVIDIPKRKRWQLKRSRCIDLNDL